MTVTLNLQTIRTLVSPAGDTPLVRALYLKQYHKNLVRLHHLHERLVAQAPALVERTGFSQGFEKLCAFSAAAQHAVLSYPSVSFWLDVAGDLLNRQAHLRFPEMHIQMHLEEFWRVVLAVAIKAGTGNFECMTWSNAKGKVVLPGTGIYLDSPELMAYQRVEIAINNGTITRGKEDAEGSSALNIAGHAIATLANNIELNAVDTDLQMPGRGSFKFAPLEPADITRWQSPLEQSWMWIGECMPKLSAEMLMSLRTIIPVESATVGVHISASFREAPGLIALSWTPDAAVMVEALVHEYHHQKLNALLNLDPLIAGPSTEAIYYSPWRNDARPLLGILHGAFAFQAVLQFWQAFFSAGLPLLQEARIRQRLYLLKAQVQTAIQALADEAQLTPFGEALVAEMRDVTNRIDADLPDTERAIQQRIEQLQTEHRTKWEQEHGRRKDPLKDHQTAAILDKPANQTEQAALDWLALKTNFEPETLSQARYHPDPLLNAVIFAYYERDIAELKALLPETARGESLLLDLLGGHLAYVANDYERAATLYESCLAHNSSSVHFWQYFAFALRHLMRWNEAEAILTNLSRLAGANPVACSPGSDGEDAVESRLKYVNEILNPRSCSLTTT